MKIIKLCGQRPIFVAYNTFNQNTNTMSEASKTLLYNLVFVDLPAWPNLCLYGLYVSCGMDILWISFVINMFTPFSSIPIQIDSLSLLLGSYSSVLLSLLQTMLSETFNIYPKRCLSHIWKFILMWFVTIPYQHCLGLAVVKDAAVLNKFIVL